MYIDVGKRADDADCGVQVFSLQIIIGWGDLGNNEKFQYYLIT